MNNNAITTEPVSTTDEEELLFDFEKILVDEDHTEDPTECRANEQPSKMDGVVIGRLVGQDSSGQPLVDFSGKLTSTPLAAQAIVSFETTDFDRRAALMFEGGDPSRPILMGLIHEHEPAMATHPIPVTPLLPLSIQADDERIELKADREIVLKCGKASITLTRAGKVLIRGAYLLNRSSGVNRIKGGSVQIN